MKAAVVHAFGAALDIEEAPIPRPGPGQVLVKVAARGVCHTDLHAIDGDCPVKPTLPFIPGHEAVGFVVAVGAGEKHIKEGDRVGVPWLYSACGRCSHCLGGWETLCEAQQNTGYSVNGGFAEYVLADARYVGHLPARTEFVEIAPVLCAGVTVYKGLKVTDTKPGDWIAISGIGGLGHMAVQYAIAMGRNVAAVDIDDAKLALAKKLGAAIAVNAKTICYRAARQIGSLAAALGGLDALVFTAGVGEHAPAIRDGICRLCAWLGVQLDPAANAGTGPRISSEMSKVQVWVIPTDEELMIARHTRAVVG